MSCSERDSKVQRSGESSGRSASSTCTSVATAGLHMACVRSVRVGGRGLWYKLKERVCELRG